MITLYVVFINVVSKRADDLEGWVRFVQAGRKNVALGRFNLR